ncbi:MAG: Hsp20/alpha crystallin family protein [Candidatus Binataceae bacterium]
MELRYENGWTGNGWLLDRMNGVVQEMTRTPRRITPSVDVVEEKDGYHFYFEMPGLKSDAFDVRVEHGSLIVTAERKQPERANDARVHVAERGYGTFRRAFELPEDASPDRVHAAYKDGVLEITVEKRPESKPVKIQVN